MGGIAVFFYLSLALFVLLALLGTAWLLRGARPLWPVRGRERLIFVRNKPFR